MSTADELRDNALALPGVSEGTHFRLPDFRVRDAVFAVMQPEDYAVLHVDPDAAHAAAARVGVELTYRGNTVVGFAPPARAGR